MKIFALAIVAIATLTCAEIDIKKEGFNEVDVTKGGTALKISAETIPSFVSYYNRPLSHFYLSIWPLTSCSSIHLQFSESEVSSPFILTRSKFTQHEIIYNVMEREIKLLDNGVEKLKAFWDRAYIPFNYDFKTKSHQISTVATYTGNFADDVKAPIMKTSVNVGLGVLVTTSSRYCHTRINYIGHNDWVHFPGRNGTTEHDYNQADFQRYPTSLEPKVDLLPAASAALLKNTVEGEHDCVKRYIDPHFVRSLPYTVWDTKDEIKVHKVEVAINNVAEEAPASFKVAVGKCDWIRIKFGELEKGAVDPRTTLDIFPGYSFFVPTHTNEAQELHVDGSTLPYFKIEFSDNPKHLGMVSLSYFSTGYDTMAYVETMKLPFNPLEKGKELTKFYIVHSPNCEAAAIQDLKAHLSGGIARSKLRIKNCRTMKT